MNKVIIAVLGKDRPGIIAAVSGVLYELECNIENVSQTILQTQFSGTFIVGVPDPLTGSDLRRQLCERLRPMNLDVFIKAIEEPPAGGDEPASEPFVITTRGPDQKGLVARVTAVIAKHSVNVTNLQAVFKGGENPHDNIMIYEVDIPVAIDQQALRRELRQKAEELELEISIQHRHVFEAINRV
jgi:glycine cleavage system transcriptional repressor